MALSSCAALTPRGTTILQRAKTCAAGTGPFPRRHRRTRIGAGGTLRGRTQVHEPTTAPAPPETADALFVEVYDRLKAMASRELARSDGATLNTTALVHELYMKVCAGHELTFAEPAQFFGYAAQAMRHILVDRARQRLRIKRGGGADRRRARPERCDRRCDGRACARARRCAEEARARRSARGAARDAALLRRAAAAAYSRDPRRDRAHAEPRLALRTRVPARHPALKRPPCRHRPPFGVLRRRPGVHLDRRA